MATLQQREELHRTIWGIAEELRNEIDGWEFKSYVLGSLFYRFISENLTNYINDLQKEAGVVGFDYAKMRDEDAEAARAQMVQEKGFFILPSQLFANVCKKCEKDENLNMTLSKVFKSIEGSAIGTDSEDDLRGLFSDFNVDNSKLGGDVKSRNKIIAKVLLNVKDMKLGTAFEENEIDAFGDAYEYLMGMYASNAGKSGGEYFTPQEVSELLANLTAADGHEIHSVYDPACGSGSLLLKFSKTIGKEYPALKYYGQEINPTTYNLCRINMFLHNINYDNFDIQLENTLTQPQHRDLEPFDAIVSNPPYSKKWDGSQNPLLINDDRYAGPGVLAPDDKSDFAFVLHILQSLSESGTAAIVEYPGILTRGGKEKTIRHWLLEKNAVDSVIQLPSNLFFGPSIPTCIIVLRKGTRPDNKVLFINASNEFKKVGNKNKLMPNNQKHILDVFKNRIEEPYFSSLIPTKTVIDEFDSNLSPFTYVEKEFNDQDISIIEVNDSVESALEEAAYLNKKIESYETNLDDFSTEVVEWKALSELLDYEQPTPYIVKSTNYDDSFKTPVLTAGQSVLLGYTDETEGIYEASEESPVIIFDDFTTSFHWITYNFKVKSSAMKMLRPRVDVKANFRYIYYAMKQIKFIPSQHQRHWISKYSNFKIPMLPPETQERIVEILDTYSSSILNANKQAKLRQKQYEYYRNLFLDFEKGE